MVPWAGDAGCGSYVSFSTVLASLALLGYPPMAALPILHARHTGHFIQVSSVGGRVGGTPGLAPYQAAKFGVEGFSLAPRSEVEPLGIRVTIIEPGALRTDWGGSSMHIADVGPDYQQTVGRFHGYRRDVDGRQPGDPVKAARVIFELAALDDPPLRLLLGSDALDVSQQAERVTRRSNRAVGAGEPLGRLRRQSPAPRGRRSRLAALLDRRGIAAFAHLRASQ